MISTHQKKDQGDEVSKPKTVEEIRNLVDCALVNLEHLFNSVPSLSDSAHAHIIAYQLKCALTDDESTVVYP